MRFLLDQDVSNQTYRLLKEEGHDVVRVKDLGMAEAPDEDILREAHRKGCVLITRDKGYGALVFLAVHPTTGVILLRYVPAELDDAHAELLRMLKAHSFERLCQSVASVGPGQFRLRHVLKPS